MAHKSDNLAKVKISKKMKKKVTCSTPGVPKWSPSQVLTGLDVA